jgi:hypothetical protein
MKINLDIPDDVSGRLDAFVDLERSRLMQPRFSRNDLILRAVLAEISSGYPHGQMQDGCIETVDGGES